MTNNAKTLLDRLELKANDDDYDLVLPDGYSMYLKWKSAKHLLDCIRAEFIQKPISPNGHPWRIGNMTDFGMIVSMTFDGVQWVAGLDNPNNRRPMHLLNFPIVVDAEGAPIEVGDIIYSTLNGTEYKVTDIFAWEPEGNLVVTNTETEVQEIRYSKQMTHLPPAPDTIDAVIEDMRKSSKYGMLLPKDEALLSSYANRLEKIRDREVK